MIKQLTLITAALLCVLTSTIQPKASAADTGLENINDQLYSTCTNTSLERWNWPEKVKSTSSGTGSIPNFDHADSSYILYKLPGQPTPNLLDSSINPANKSNRYGMIVGIGGDLTLDLDATDGKPFVNVPGGSMQTSTIISEPQDQQEYKGNWPGSYSGNATSISSFQTIPGSKIALTYGVENNNPYTVSPGLLNCMVVAHNVNYGSRWTFGKFVKNQPYGNSSGQCATLDIGCQISRLSRNIGNTIADIFEGALNALARLFIPDGDAIRARFNALQTFLSDKLGFLAYPFTFINQFFSAFTSGSSWCNSSSCSKNFGNLFGRPFVMNLGQMQTTMPTIWTWFTAMIRGVTILALLFAVRQKYRQVTSK